MKSWTISTLVLSFLLAVEAAGQADKPAAPTQFLIQVTVFKGDPLGSREAGTLSIESRPQIVTLDKRPAEIQVGGPQIPTVAPKDRKRPSKDARGGPGLEYRLRVAPTKQDEERVHLEVTFELTKSAAQTEDWTQVQTEGTRLVGTFKFREAIKVPCGRANDGERVWAELRVEELPPMRQTAPRVRNSCKPMCLTAKTGSGRLDQCGVATVAVCLFLPASGR